LHSDEAGSDAIPTGLITLLFSDIEGSTTRWDTYPDAMPVALRRHDALLQHAITSNRGHVFKTVGDEFCSVFSDARDAVAAAIAAQRALLSEDWSHVGGLRVRMALHMGTTHERDGDYYGPPVNRVARMLAAGHGGQVLVSDACARGLENALSNGFALRDLGRHRLKDFPELEQIYQLTADALPDIFPPLRTIADRPTNLPQQLSGLIGRDADIAEIKNLLGEQRLVSIVGAGGVGKTSIALRVGGDLLQDYEDGVWTAELASLTDATLVASTIAHPLGITATSSSSILDALVSYLKNKNALLIIDNCEHLLHATAEAVTAIIRGCAKVKVIATTREPLAITGEFVYRLPSLSTPPQRVTTADKIGTYGAVMLFVERARTHVRGFELTNQNARIVADICRRLDGIALAIELAAARLRVLSVEHLAARLEERFRILTGGSRTALPRQQTLRALIDWSYDLLSDKERKLFCRAATFAGGWTLAAAMDVCSDDSLDAVDILDLLTSLVDKSLVICDTASDEPRYRMLESTRQYASERLIEGAEQGTIAQKHAQHYLALATRAAECWSTITAKEWIAPLTPELDNFRAALTWLLSEPHHVELAISLFTELEAFWWDVEPLEGRRWVNKLAPHLATVNAPNLIAKFWYTASNIALTLRQQKGALENADRALNVYDSLSDESGRATVQRCRGAALINLGRIDEGEICLNDALRTFRSLGNRRLIGLALRSLARVPHERGDLAGATTLYREALGYAEILCDERGAQIILGNLAEAEADAGNHSAALQHAREALEISRMRRDGVKTCTDLVNIAAYLIVLDRYEEARGAAQEALDLALEIESDLHSATAIQHLGAVCSVSGDPVRAAHLLGCSDALYRAIESPREPTEAKEYERCRARLTERLGVEELARHLAEGAKYSAQEMRAEALLV